MSDRATSTSRAGFVLIEEMDVHGKEIASMSFQPFIVVFTLTAPVGHGLADHPPFMMLDGLVGYAVAQELFGPRAYTRRVHKNTFIDLPLPLDRALPGVYAASQGFAPVARSSLIVFTSPYDRGSIDKFATPNKKGEYMPPVIPAKHQPTVTPVAALQAPRMVFFGRGDVSEVARLLRRHIKFLGFRRSAGMGHVVHVDVVPTVRDWSWSRWDGETVSLHRALPVNASHVADALTAQWGDEAAEWWTRHESVYPRTRLAVSPPYHDPNRQQWCYEPTHYGLAEAATFLDQWPEYAPWNRVHMLEDDSDEAGPDEDTWADDADEESHFSHTLL